MNLVYDPRIVNILNTIQFLWLICRGYKVLAGLLLDRATTGEQVLKCEQLAE